ncbi:MAG: signal peptidase I [bacterium]|nr:signal peptidase I [bacterium]
MDDLQELSSEVLNKDATPNNKGSRRSFFNEIIRLTIIIVVVVLPIRMFIAKPFLVSGSSMLPTFENGEYLIIDEISYRFENPKRGEVIVFKYPEDKERFLIKRIVALPRETLKIGPEGIFIINSENPKGFLLDERYVTYDIVPIGTLTLTLKEDEYFVMGDNRPASLDSRIWGPLSKDFIVGKPFVRLFPPQRLDFFPGQEVTEN